MRPDRPAPLVVVLHGAGGHAEGALALLRPVADRAGAILLAPAGRTTTNQLTGALDALDTVGAKVAGVVLSMVPTRGPDAYPQVT